MSSLYYSKRLRMDLENRLRKRAGQKGAKTFKSEEAAKKWAASQNIADFELVNLRVDPRATPKIKVVPKSK